jgi:hypothetical protein
MKKIYLDLLERYHNGEMTPGEMTAFESSLADDPELSKAFDEYKLILEALKDTEVIDLRTKLRGLMEEKPGEYKKTRFLEGGNWLWLAALITLFLGLSVVVTLLVKETRSVKRLTAENVYEEMTNVSGLNKELMKFALRGHGQIIHTPSDTCNIIMEGDVLFTWSVDSTYNLLLDVINREGKVVFVSHRPLQSPFLFKNNLEEGIYVFRFRDSKEAFSLTVMYLKH